MKNGGISTNSSHRRLGVSMSTSANPDQVSAFRHFDRHCLYHILVMHNLLFATRHVSQHRRQMCIGVVGVDSLTNVWFSETMRSHTRQFSFAVRGVVCPLQLLSTFHTPLCKGCKVQPLPISNLSRDNTR